jgi:hypothetical protein
MHKTMLKPVRTYGIQLWGMASTSNIEILEHFQSIDLCIIADTFWYVLNVVIQQLKKKSITTALNTVLASAHTQTSY